MPTTLPPRAVPPDAARPYGVGGLVLSTIVILIVASLLCVVAAIMTFGLASVAIGWHEALERFADLDASGGKDPVFRGKLSVAVGLVIYAALSAAILLAARWRGGALWRDLVAWKPWSPFRRSLPFWGLFGLVLAYSLAANAAIAHFYPTFEDLVQMPKGTKWALLFFALATIFAPVTEELLFRGWIYTSLRRSIGVRASILVTAILFALAHWEDTHLYALAVFPVGLALCYTRERTGSIKASIAFHAAYNGVASVLLLLAR